MKMIKLDLVCNEIIIKVVEEKKLYIKMITRLSKDSGLKFHNFIISRQKLNY
jgi:hypothetical protein